MLWSAYVLTIENLASFIRHVREVNRMRDGLVIYTGGFPGRASLDAIVALAGTAAAPTFHWGDLDPGGVRIFVHLERALAAVGLALQPHLMSPELLTRRGSAPRRERARQLGTPPEGTAISTLWTRLAEQNLELEQEALDPQAPASTRR